MILYSSSTQDNTPPRAVGRYIRIGIAALIGVIIFVMISHQVVILFMNVKEFSHLFTKPLYYSLISAVILASIVLIRVNVKNRSSIAWYIVDAAINFLKKGTNYSVTENIPSFKDHKLSIPNFIIWQITKVLLFGAFFTNLIFGFAVLYMLQGNDLGVQSLWGLFSLPFATTPTDASKGKPKLLDYIATIEGIIGIGILWAGINMFFIDQIDYNTKYAIGGTIAVGFALIAFYFVDKFKSKVIIHPSRRDVYIRILTIITIAVIAGSVMAVNNSIADAKKIEYLGPYKAQQIGVNRYLGQLDQIQITSHEVKQSSSIQPTDIPNYVMQNNALLSKIRIWDLDGAFAKIKPEIGLIPYVDFENNDILRFNDTLYWTASMKPVLPSSVSLENKWYNQHLVYTYVDTGFVALDASNGTIVDSNNLFKQRVMYYGEGGLFTQTWAAYPVKRGVNTAELNNASYNGKGGIDVYPPISQIFEPNFFLSYPTEPIHIIRYRDIHDRMQLLYPYFQY